MRYYPRIVTRRGTIRIFNGEWQAERWGSLVQEHSGIKAGDLKFVAIEFMGDVPKLLNTNDSPDAYGNEICRLERV